MAKSYSLIFVSLFLLALSGCQSLEQISIDYLQPADLSFPPQLRRVAIVNNTSDLPDNKLIIETGKNSKTRAETSLATAYANGDAKIAVEAMAKEIAHQNYFEEVVICDSALRANDKLTRENMLSKEEVNTLANGLGVDFIIALENIQFKVTKKLHFLSEFNCYQGTIDLKAYPVVRIYLPERSKPMVTLSPNDSIFWEEYGATLSEVSTHLISDKQLLQEASEFAGIMPVKYLTPSWEKGTRYLYTGGSIQMRDAAVYVREDSWNKAYELWKQTYESTKSSKKKMQAALNIAVYYEMTDSIAKAEEWAVKAQEFAMKTDKLDKVTEGTHINIGNVPNYYAITLYVNKLKERNAQMPKLNMQMSRFHDDF